MTTAFRLFTAAALLVPLAASPASAQEHAPGDAAPALVANPASTMPLAPMEPTTDAPASDAAPASARSGAPAMSATAIAMRAVPAAANVQVPEALQRRATSRAAAHMIVGGAAIVLGVVIDDSVGELFVLGGAILFLYGLYQYLT